MATPGVTNTLIDGQTIQPGPLNTNFSDITTGLNSGLWDINIGVLTTVSGIVCNGDSVLGNGAGDQVTVSGTVASDLIPKSASTYSLGSAALGWNKVYVGGTLASGSTAATNAIYNQGFSKAWGYIGSMATILGGFNINAATRASTGIYTIVVQNSFNTLNYVVNGMCVNTATAAIMMPNRANSSTFSTRLLIVNGATLADIPFSFVVFG